MNENGNSMIYEVLFGNILDDIENNTDTEDYKTFRDEDFRQDATKQISNRDEKYTELLAHFVCITRIRNYLKEFFKWTFYLALIISIVVLVKITYDLFNKYISSAEIEEITEALPLLITSLVGFVSAIITIPVTITKYLFSTNEDKNITEIILHTQDHDTSGRDWATNLKKIIDKSKELSENQQDLDSA